MKIVAFPRKEQGSGASRRLRRSGQTPGIVYGGTESPVTIALDHNALYYALKKEAFHSSILDLEVDGQTEKVLLRDFQMHAFKPLVLHVDFQRVQAEQPINVKVPLHFINGEASPAVKLSSAVITHVLNDLEITCLPGDLPESIQVDLSTIEAGQSVHLADIQLPPGVTAVSQENLVLVTTTIPAGNIGAEDEGEGEGAGEGEGEAPTV